MSTFSFDRTGFHLDGKDAYLVSGEFHYFRVPREDWKRRMQLFIEAGGNCLATYVPWLIHEPEEGKISFGGQGIPDLRAFLETAQEMGLKVLLRPGPYQYSELRNAGLPEWLLENYPEVRAVALDGGGISPSPNRRGYSVSYLHPLFLEKARRYFRAFADAVRPFMMENGGPVCMLQVDNELSGIHVWYGSLDYHPETMGFLQEDGRYPLWLRRKYGTIEQLNAAYGTRYIRFAYALPIDPSRTSTPEERRRVRDYDAFYRDTMAEYLALLAGWLREDGLGGPICHNSANPGMNGLFAPTVQAMKNEPFLLGSDHYYTLNQSWRQNNPTPQYALRVLSSCDTMRALGMPPSVLELPGGSPSDTPPILGPDLLACHMTNLALGMKGLNYYIFTGGPNAPGTGTTCDIYDYCASVRADGSVNEETYPAIQRFGRFMQEHAWLQRARRYASVQVGFEWRTHASEGPAFQDADRCDDLLEKGVLYSLMCSHYSPEMVLLTEKPDLSRPMIVPCGKMMSSQAQKSVADFVHRGGQVLLIGSVPVLDLEEKPEETLLSLLGGARFEKLMQYRSPVTVEENLRVYGISFDTTCCHLPPQARVTARSEEGDVLGFEMPAGKGRVMWFGGSWNLENFQQAQMMEGFMQRLGAQKCVESSNRNLFTALWTNETGRAILFVMNLYSSPQSTRLYVHAGIGRDLGEIQLDAMEVRVIEL